MLTIEPRGTKFAIIDQATLQPVGEPFRTAAKAAAHLATLQGEQNMTDTGEHMHKAAGTGEAALFIPLAKIDQAKHQVWGYGAVEEGDISNEIMDFTTSLPHFQKWSADASARSGGKSLGNLRSMHQSLAAGRLVAFQPDHKKKGFWIGAEVVDPAEWEKVEKGVYTGFSIGGDYAARWFDPAVSKVRYTAKPIEISLVDSPCIPSATFQVVKADSSIELRKFAPTNGQNMLKAEMPSSPTPAGSQDLGPVRWSDITVDRMPDQDLMMQVSPGDPPDGSTLASRHRGVMTLGTQIEEILDAAGLGPRLTKRIASELSDLVKAAAWDEAKHHRDHGKFSSTEGASGGAAPKAESGGAYSQSDAPEWKKKQAETGKPAGSHHAPIGEGWNQVEGMSGVTHSKQAGDKSAFVTHPDQAGGSFKVQTFDRGAGSQATGAGVKNETTTHPTREAAYAHAEQHLNGGAKPAAQAPKAEQKSTWYMGESTPKEGQTTRQARQRLSQEQDQDGKHVTMTHKETGESETMPVRQARQRLFEDQDQDAEAKYEVSDPFTPGAKPAAGAQGTGKPAGKPSNGVLFSDQAAAADQEHMHAAKTPEEKKVWANGPKAILNGREEDDPSITPAEHKAIAMHHHYMAQGTGDPTGEHKAKEQAHEAAAAKKSPPAPKLQPISAEQRAQQEQDGMTFSTAGKPKGEHPGKALAEKWADDPDAPEITPDEHYKMANYYQQAADEGGDNAGENASHAWAHSIAAAGKTNGHKKLPDVLMTASHEHYEKTGMPLPKPDAQSGAHILRSSRIRGKGGTVGYHPKTGNWGASYQTNDPISGEPRWTTETGTALKNNSGELTSEIKHHSSQAAAGMYLAQHVEGGVKKAVAMRRPLPALAKRGAMPLEKAKRLVKVTQTNPRQPTSGEPRKIKVKA